MKFEKLPAEISKLKENLKVSQKATAEEKDPKKKQYLKDYELYYENLLKTAEEDLIKYQAHLKDPANIPHPMKEKGIGLTEEEKKSHHLKMYEKNLIETAPKMLEHMKTSLKQMEDPKDSYYKELSAEEKALYLASTKESLKKYEAMLEKFKAVGGDHKKKEAFLEEMVKEFYGTSGVGFGGGYGSGGGYGTSVAKQSECYYAFNTFTGIAQNLKYKKRGSCGLLPEELNMLFFYTGSGYSCLNSYLRQSSIKDDGNDLLVKVLNDGLDKLPSYEGFVRRGAELPQAIRDVHKTGNVVTYESYTSTSTGNGFGGTDMFIIYSRNGKPIMGLSGIEHENEVLFKSSTKFKVLDVQKKNSTNQYVLKEVIEGGDPQAEEALDKEILEQVASAQKTPPAKIGTDKWYCPLDESEKIPKIYKQQHLPSLK